MVKRWLFIANELDEMKDRRAAVENNGLVLVAVEIDHFLAFGNGGEWLRGEAEGFQRLSGGMELAESAVNQNEGW